MTYYIIQKRQEKDQPWEDCGPHYMSLEKAEVIATTDRRRYRWGMVRVLRREEFEVFVDGDILFVQKDAPVG